MAYGDSSDECMLSSVMHSSMVVIVACGDWCSGDCMCVVCVVSLPIRTARCYVQGAVEGGCQGLGSALVGRRWLGCVYATVGKYVGIFPRSNSGFLGLAWVGSWSVVEMFAVGGWSRGRHRLRQLYRRPVFTLACSCHDVGVWFREDLQWQRLWLS